MFNIAKYSKFIVALATGVETYVNSYYGANSHIATTVSLAVGAFLVYIVPNNTPSNPPAVTVVSKPKTVRKERPETLGNPSQEPANVSANTTPNNNGR